MNAKQLILILLGVAHPTMSLQRGSSVGKAEQLLRVSPEASGPKQPTSIYATYGKNCGDGVGKNVTEAMMERCPTFPCEWKIDNTGADPYHGCPKNMDITLQCGTETVTAHKGGEAGGQTISVGCPAECPSGWVQLGEIGDDIPGWGFSHDGNKAVSVSDCAAQCDAEKPKCGSFEFTERTSDCALYSWKDTSTEKQTSHVDGMLMCQLSPPSCPPGYSQIGMLGNDIPGWGLVSDGNQAESTEACAAQCDARSDCGCFEFVGGDCGLFSWETSESSFSGTVYNMLTCQKPPTPAPTPAPTSAPTVPSGQCIWNNTQCASIDNWEDELFGKCRCFGDPHCTETFYKGMPSTYFQGNGVYDMASSTDGCFQMQQFQCPFVQGFNPPGYSVGVGLAVKMEGKTIVFSRNNMYVDGELVNKSSATQYPFNLNLDGYVPGAVELTSWDKCLRLSLHTEGAIWFLGGNPTAFHNFHLVAMKSLLTKKGLCGDTDDTHTPVDRSDLLFTASQVEELCDLCTGPGKPQICYPSPVPTPPPVVPPGPKEACENADPPIPYSTAEAACSAVQGSVAYFEACILDYCMTGGNDNIPNYIINETPDPTPVPTPAPPTTAPPTAPPTQSTTPVPQCTNCGPRPMECWATCGGKRGYCSACDSLSGRRGACCYQGGPSDPPAPPSDEYADECQTVDRAQFVHTGYHMCVLPDV